MRSAVAMCLGVWVAVTPVLAGVAFGAQAGGAPQTPSPVPGSLDAFYPPAAGQPVYLLHMLKLDEHFSGIVVDLMEDDWSGARTNYAEFKAQYAAVRGMVPEWEPHYPTGPVDDLGAAFEAGDRGRLMAAFEEVGKTCHRCHEAAMVPVQQRYHWGDFGVLRVQDPLSGELTDFARFKRTISMNLAGIRVDVGQGQRENALRQFDGFKARFQALKESCRSCHEGERQDYVGGEAEALMERLERALENPDAAPEALSGLAQDIGRESCSRCHRVHVPAAVGRAAQR